MASDTLCPSRATSAITATDPPCCLVLVFCTRMGATMKPLGHHDDNPNAVYFNHIHAAAAVVPHLLRGFRIVQCAPMTSSAQVASQLHLSNCFLLISPPFFPYLLHLARRSRFFCRLHYKPEHDNNVRRLSESLMKSHVAATRKDLYPSKL